MIASARPPLGAALAILLTLVTLSGAVGPAAMAVLVVLLSVMIAAGWPDALELPSPVGSRVIVAGTGIVSAVLTLATAATKHSLWGVLIAGAMGVFASFLHQMFRRRRDGLSVSLTGTVAGAMLTAISGAWVLAQALAGTPLTVGVLTACGGGLAIALLVCAVPARKLVRLVAAVVLAIVATAALASALGGMDWWVGALVGAVVGIGASGVHLLLDSVLPAEEPLSSMTTAAAPVATVGVVALLLVRILS
jgi:iron complex transport system permease protein